ELTATPAGSTKFSPCGSWKKCGTTSYPRSGTSSSSFTCAAAPPADSQKKRQNTARLKNQRLDARWVKLNQNGSSIFGQFKLDLREARQNVCTHERQNQSITP